MRSPVKRLAQLLRIGKAHRRLVLCAAIGAIVAVAAPFAPVTRLLIGWDVFVVLYLIGAATVMSQCTTVAQIKANAAAQDEGALAILMLSTAAAMASIGAIFAELAAVAATDPRHGLYDGLAIGTVVLSWAFIHTIFALHYAHKFYGGEAYGGLRFPDDDEPDYWDFVYFSFVIGMTFQVSDVAVSHKAMRRTVVAHGALSFFFATAVVAMTVNIAANVIQK